MKTISNSQLSIQVSSHGAELCSIISNGKEYLWQADPTFWKRAFARVISHRRQRMG